MDKFNNQFATQKLRQETSMTGTGATFTPGTGEQTAPRATKKVVKKKLTPEEKDVEPKLAAGKAKVYMKDKWGWKDAPSIPNRPSKGGFIYKQLFEELSEFVNEMKEETGSKPYYVKVAVRDAKKALEVLRDNPGYKKVELSGSDTYYTEDPQLAYDMMMDFGAHDIEVIDSHTIEDQDQPEEQGEDEDRYDWFTNTYTEDLNESYSKFKNETKTRGKSDQFHQAVREVRKKVQEINRLFEYVSRLKSELSEGEGGLKYKVHTEKALEKIKEMVAQLNQNIKKFK